MVGIEGRIAITHYKVVQYFPQVESEKLLVAIAKAKNQAKLKTALNSYQQGFSLLECVPETGRTHQIRVHLAHTGHPLVADNVYGGSKRSTLDRLWCPHQFLHASVLGFTHPATNHKQVVEAELPADLQESFNLLHI
jgi:23S rRNA pseudouridine1911/1915/1917 synthase